MEINKQNLINEVKQELQGVDIESWSSLDKKRDDNGRVIGSDNDYKGFKFYINTEAKDILDRVSHINNINQSQLMRNLIVEYLISIRDN